MFINYSPLTGVSINSFRQPSGYANWDVDGLVVDIIAGRDSSCRLEGAKDALEDGSLWPDNDVVQEVLEEVHAAICDWEKCECEREVQK